MATNEAIVDITKRVRTKTGSSLTPCTTQSGLTEAIVLTFESNTDRVRREKAEWTAISDEIGMLLHDPEVIALMKAISKPKSAHVEDERSLSELSV